MSQVPVSDPGGVSGLRFSGGGTQSQFYWGSQVPVSDFREGGTQSQIFGRGEGYPVSAKGKNFDTRFGLIHVQTGKKFFVEGPPPVKGKLFDTRFGLIHVQTGEKNFCRWDPPSSKG